MGTIWTEKESRRALISQDFVLGSHSSVLSTEDRSNYPLKDMSRGLTFDDSPAGDLSTTNSSIAPVTATTFTNAISERMSTDNIYKEPGANGISRRLYVSHFLSTWNFRTFEFGAVIFLATIFPGSLLFMSVYALVRAASAILLAPAIGRYIDNGERLKVIRDSIVYQRISVILSCVIFWIMLELKRSFAPWALYLMLSTNILLACIEKMCAITNTVSVERDWVVVIAENDEKVLCQLNSQMRRIDLFCKVVSPLIVAILSNSSIRAALLVIFCTNAVSVVVEYILIAKVYRAVPALANRPIQAAEERGDAARFCSSSLRELLDNLRFYFSQSAYLPSLSLSILYLTVLSFAGPLITYLLSVGFSSMEVGFIRMVSTVFELAATWIAPRFIRYVGPIRSGLWFLSFQMVCLGIAGTIFWAIPMPLWAATGLVCGTILSRVGLWGFDLSAQVIIQEEVQPEYRGVFSTTEAALQNLAELFAYASTMVFYKPLQFKYPTIISIIAVYISGALYANFVRDRRGHLIHHSACLKGRNRDRHTIQEVLGTL